MNAQAFPILIRREFWEHRQLWIAPLVLVIAYIAVCFLPGAINIDGDLPRGGSTTDGQFFFVGMQLFSTALLYLLMSVVTFFYLTDSLYAERKDRSILFWKSLPVSDAATVLSKLVVAMLVVPVGVVLLSVVANLLAFGIVSVRIHDSPFLQQFLQWETATWLRLNGLLLVDVVVVALWFLPVAGYQLLISAWAKSNVFVWTILPPLALTFGERLVFKTWHIGKFLLSRLTVGMAGARPQAPISGANAVQETLHRIDATPQLATLELWLGVLAGALLVYGAIRIRRYRDDS